MTADREQIRQACIAMLDAAGTEHPLGHQPSKARRYVVTAPGGKPHEVMFEQNEKVPPNIWITTASAGGLVGGSIEQKPSPAAKLRTRDGKNGKVLYGRHSALEKMSELGDADLVCFNPQTIFEVRTIVDQILSHSAAGP
ncbi:hypothetical protein [Novosphingobium percolationis]|uniref:hypothetical protein n=1 Tax=Novosphingobium percolationis TaxID=2871811 RepID=UPI001CD2183E|nr:hypothetical protein [Novosphingobium percolationis]